MSTGDGVMLPAPEAQPYPSTRRAPWRYSLVAWVRALFEDEKGMPSSKRVIGFLAALALLRMGVAESKASDALVYSIVALALGGLGLASIDKLTARVWGKGKAE